MQNSRLLIAAVVVVIGLAALGAWLISSDEPEAPPKTAIAQDEKELKANSEPDKPTLSQNSSSSSSSTPATGTSQDLVESGPGDVLAIFVAGTVAGTLIMYRRQLHHL